MGGPVWQRMMETLPVEIIPLYLNPDGNFPNHEGDPLKDINVVDLKAKILETHADLGIALDGDADRVFFFDEKAQRQSGTVTMALFIDHFMRVQKRIGYYLYDIRIGKVIPELVNKYGGTPLKVRAGHSFIKAKMREVDGIFGGEASGHFYFKDNFNAECTLTAGLMMIEMLSASDKPFSELSKEFDIYPQSGEINFKIKDKTSILQAARSRFSEQAESVEEIDGVNFNYSNWWFNIRFSNTEPVMRINVEADTQEILDEKLALVVQFIEESGGVRK
jgi:phosphomannomutase